MQKWIVAIVLGAAPVLAGAQEIQPGQWQFSATVTSPMFSKPQTNVVTNCVTKEDAADPGAWTGDKGTSDCTSKMKRRAGDAYDWEMTCPKSNMTATGTVLIGAGTVETESTVLMNMQGRKMEMHTKMKGRRLGPCKS